MESVITLVSLLIHQIAVLLVVVLDPLGSGGHVLVGSADTSESPVQNTVAFIKYRMKNRNTKVYFMYSE